MLPIFQTVVATVLSALILFLGGKFLYPYLLRLWRGRKTIRLKPMSEKVTATLVSNQMRWLIPVTLENPTQQVIRYKSASFLSISLDRYEGHYSVSNIDISKHASRGTVYIPADPETTFCFEIKLLSPPEHPIKATVILVEPHGNVMKEKVVLDPPN